MKRYIYNYQTLVRFSQPVKRHAVLLRALPVIGSYMEVVEEHLLISPAFHLLRGTDPLGNRIAYGCQHEEHDNLAYVSTGIVDMDEYRVAPDAIPVMAYREPTPLTYLTEDELESVGALPQDAPGICHLVYQKLRYVPGMTTTETTASEVLAAGQGVCQDYAHLMIALCRASGMAARYVCGMMEGEGETHAWVEVFDGKAWTGYDPTHDVAIRHGYLKLGHGRDAADCPVSRGIYMGNASQETEVHVMLKEI